MLATLLVIAASAEAAELIRSGKWVGEVKSQDGKFFACELASPAPSTRDLIFNVLTITGYHNQNIDLTFELFNHPLDRVTVPNRFVAPWIEETKLEVSLLTGGREDGQGAKEIFKRTYSGTALNSYSSTLSGRPLEGHKSSRINFTLDKDDPLFSNFAAADWLKIWVAEPFNRLFKLRFKLAITLPTRPRATDASRALATIKSCVAKHTNMNTKSHN